MTAAAMWPLAVNAASTCYHESVLQCFDAVGWVAGRASGLKKSEWWGAGVVICLEHMAQLMPLPLTVSCFSNIQIGFAFLVPAYLGSPGQRAEIVLLSRVSECVDLCSA